jgi:hypothetical protein
MKLILQKDSEKLLANGTRKREAQEEGKSLYFKPVIKLFTPDAQAPWLLREINPEYPTMIFGLCDLGVERPEPCYVSLEEISTIGDFFLVCLLNRIFIL